MTSLPEKLSGYRDDLSVYKVSQCPDNETTWKAAAKTLGCNVDYNNKNNPYRHYYCLPTQSKSELVHFCYDKFSYGIQKGACLALGNNGDLTNVDCQNFENGCPDKPYLSETIYRFQACLEINTEQRCYLAVNGCLPATSKTIITTSTEAPTTSDILSKTTNSSISDNFTELPAVKSTFSKFFTSTVPQTVFDTNDNSDYTAIILAIVLIVLVVFGGLIIFICWKKKPCSRKQPRKPHNGIEHSESDENGVHLPLIENPTKIEITGNQSVVFGSSARFTSTVVCDQVPSSVKWQKSDGVSFSDIEITDEKYAGSTVDPKHPVLVINNANFSDTAMYRLLADQVFSDGIQLHVTGTPPEVYLSGITQEENKVVIMCSASAKPDSPNIKKITWKKDGKEIIINNNNRHKYRHGNLHSYSLVIYNLERSDAGSYSVVVENDVGNTASNVFELDELFTRPIQIQAVLSLALLQVYRTKSWRTTKEFFGCHMNKKFDNVSNVFADNEKELSEFIYKTNGHGYNYRSPREKNSVFLSFVKNIKFLDFFIENASKESLMAFCRTTNYQSADGEVCANLSVQQTEKFIDKVHLNILTHRTLKDTTMHERISKRLKIPVEILKWGRLEIENYHKQLTSGSVCVYHARGMIVGCGGAGKTTLLKKLKNMSLEEVIKTSSTRGIDIETDVFNVFGNNIKVTDKKVAAYINISNTEDATGHNKEEAGVSESGCVNITSRKKQITTMDNSNNKLEGKPEAHETIERTPDSDKKPGTDQVFAHENISHSILYERNHKLEAFPDGIEETEDEENESNVKELHTLAGLSGFSKDILKSITFLDFAGQDTYYACHHIYLSPRAFYVLVIDMSKSLDDKVSEVDHGSLYSGWTYKDFIVFWMKSIHTYSSSTAPVILIASHSEGKSKEDVIDFFCDVCELLPETIQKAHLDRERMFAVELESDKSINDLKKCIATLVQKLYHWGERRPTSWVIFEQNLRRLSKDNKIIKTEDLWKQNKTLGENVQLDNINKMREMLSFFHDTGIILFFNEEHLREIVILDVQWFVNSFKNVITDYKHAKEDLPSNIKEWKKFNATGILQRELLLDIWGRDGNTYKPYMNEIMRYMESLGMLAKTKDIPTQTWYVPCANRRPFPKEQFEGYSVSSTLCFEFDFLPSIVYYRLIAWCIRQLQFVISTTGEQETECLYRLAMVFQTKHLKGNYILIGMCQNSIELQILSRFDVDINKHESTNLKRTIETNLKHIMKTFHTNLGYFTIGYRCRNVLYNENPSTHIVHKSAFTDSSIYCGKCDFQMKEKINVGEVLSYWNQTLEVDVELFRSLKLPGLTYGLHMSCLTSEKAWICDDDGNLALIDANEQILQKVDELDQTYLYGYHCLTSDGELLYADWYNQCIKKVTKDNEIHTFINTWDLIPRCIFCSKQNGDILVGMKEKLDNGMVVRYNRSGKVLQEIENQENRILFKWPRYITENIQGDIVVSEYGRAVVVVDKSGQFRFEYECDPRGICTDRLGNILICDYPRHVIHRLDKDGNFLSYLITYGHETESPAGISLDEKHNLWIGHFMNDTVRVYKYLHNS